MYESCHMWMSHVTDYQSKDMCSLCDSVCQNVHTHTHKHTLTHKHTHKHTHTHTQTQLQLPTPLIVCAPTRLLANARATRTNILTLPPLASVTARRRDALLLQHRKVHSCVTWLIHTWHDSFICYMTRLYVAWLIDTWHDSFICDMTHSYVTWLIHMWHDSSTCDMTHSCVM